MTAHLELFTKHLSLLTTIVDTLEEGNPLVKNNDQGVKCSKLIQDLQSADLEEDLKLELFPSDNLYLSISQKCTEAILQAILEVNKSEHENSVLPSDSATQKDVPQQKPQTTEQKIVDAIKVCTQHIEKSKNNTELKNCYEKQLKLFYSISNIINNPKSPTLLELRAIQQDYLQLNTEYHKYINQDRRKIDMAQFSDKDAYIGKLEYLNSRFSADINRKRESSRPKSEPKTAKSLTTGEHAFFAGLYGGSVGFAASYAAYKVGSLSMQHLVDLIASASPALTIGLITLVCFAICSGLAACIHGREKADSVSLC